MTTNTKTNIEIWLYDNVFNNQKIPFRSALWSFYNRTKRRVAIIKSWSILFKFWKIPTYISNFNNAVDFAKDEIKHLNNEIGNKEYLIERLIERLVDEYVDQQMSEEEAHREAYKFAYRGDDEWYRYLPSKFQTEKEEDEIFDNDLDAYLTRDPIGDATNEQMMNYELCQLKEGGIYENANR